LLNNINLHAVSKLKWHQHSNSLNNKKSE